MNYLRHILLLLVATLCALSATADCVLPAAADTDDALAADQPTAADTDDALAPADSTQWCLSLIHI